jgi:hypothetical protein
MHSAKLEAPVAIGLRPSIQARNAGLGIGVVLAGGVSLVSIDNDVGRGSNSVRRENMPDHNQRVSRF